jgi:hypothetical protein
MTKEEAAERVRWSFLSLSFSIATTNIITIQDLFEKKGQAETGKDV